MSADGNASDEHGSDSRRRARLALSAACAAGLALRLLVLGSKGFWLDEVRSIVAARAGLEALVSGAVERYHPPLFYLLMAPWLELAGTPFLLRLPSAVLGTLSLPGIYVLADDVAGRDVAITSVWLAALSPLLVWYSQELRSYALLIALATCATVALLRLLRRPYPLAWLLYAVSTTAALYTHYNTALLLLAHVFIVVALLASGRAGRDGALTWIAGLGAAILAFVPWTSTPAFHDFLGIFTSDQLYFAPLLKRSLAIDYSSALPVVFVLVVAATLLGCLAVWMLMRRHPGALTQMRGHRTLRAGSLGLYAVILVLSVIPRGYTAKRHILTVWPLVLVGFAWIWPWRREQRGILTAVLALSLVATLANVVAIPKPQWREAAEAVIARQTAGDVVLLSPPYMVQPFQYYADQLVPTASIGQAGPEATLASLSNRYSRLWLAFGTTDVDPDRPAVLGWLGKHARRLSVTELYRVQVELYRLR